MSTQRFTPEFKEEAVRQIVERGHSVTEVSARIGVSAHSLYKWVKAVTQDKTEKQATELVGRNSGMGCFGVRIDNCPGTTLITRGAEMKYMKAILLPACLLLTLPCIGEAAGPTGAQKESLSASAHQFVEDFYEWYIPMVEKDQGGSYYEISVHWRPKAFSKALVRGLKEDQEAEAAAKDGPVGLDFDPFLNAQDICEKHAVGKTSINKNTATVEFYEICSGDPVEKQKRPSVIAELVHSDAGWQFANFKYQEGDLISTLAALKRERSKESKPGKR